MGNLLCAMQPPSEGWWEEWHSHCAICEKEEFVRREWRVDAPPKMKGERIHFKNIICPLHDCS